jgi:Tol biopolymer transport system component
MPNADASTPDANSICDPTGTFGAPVPLTGLNTANVEATPRLMADELELYFSGSLAGASGSNIYRAQRSTTSRPFGAPIALAQVDTAAGEFDPSVSSDGLMLFFGSDRVSGESRHLYVSTRTSRAGEFGAPSEVANVNSATVTDIDGQPFVTADGQELWFNSNRAGGLGAEDIYRAVWNGSNFANVMAITALSTNASDWLPTLSADKLTVYLSSNRPGGKGSFDIWTAHRSTTNDGFPAPTPVTELNSTAEELVGWLSPDNCRLYFSSAVSGTFEIYIATRHPM